MLSKIEITQISVKKRITSFITKYWIALFTLLEYFKFTALEPRYAATRNIMDILNTTCVIGLVGIGLTVVMCAGEIDFSCGMELTMGAVIMAVVLNSAVMSNYYLLVLLISFAVLIGFGLINVFFHVKIGIPAFIATMGTSLVALGLCKLLTNSGSVFSKQWPKAFTFLGQAYLFNVIPVTVIVLLVVGAIMWIYTERTKNGKSLYAVGSNTTACKYVGISAKKEKIKAFVICSVLCGFAGIIQSSQLNSANPYMGETSLINALTVLMLGATFLKSGVFNVPGTLIGSVLLVIINNGLVMVGAPAFAKDVIQGSILLVAVSAVTIIKKRQNKSLG